MIASYLRPRRISRSRNFLQSSTIQRTLARSRPDTAAFSLAQVKNADVAASAAARLLKRADIRERIAQLEQDALNRAGVTADWLVGRLRDVTERSMAAVPVMEWSAAERKLVETGEYRFDSAGANKALETLAKMRGMLTERRDMSVDADVRMVLDGELREFAE